MGSRGKKSSAEKTDAKPLAAVVRLPNLGPPQPPADLKTSDKVRWREVVNAFPADKWNPSDLLLLRDMIICEGYARECEAQIKKDGLLIKNRFGVLAEHPAAAIRARQMRQILATQRALRLAPSTRTRADSAKSRPLSGPNLSFHPITSNPHLLSQNGQWLLEKTLPGKKDC